MVTGDRAVFRPFFSSVVDWPRQSPTGGFFQSLPQPRWGCFRSWAVTQGSSCLATLGFGAESRWDSWRRFAKRRTGKPLRRHTTVRTFTSRDTRTYLSGQPFIVIIDFLRLALLFCLLPFAFPARAELFQLPTANHAIFEPGGEERFFAGTEGKTWISGTFGCVRTDGWQVHEGLDIRSVRRDKHGEPEDPVMATADGTVAYINRRPALSNYGNYIVLRHQIEGMEIFSVYAHLSAVREGLQAGQSVRAGETIATMGRTSNTHQRISKERAHVHFELDTIVNDRFAEWFQHTSPGQRNDHGNWNGQNLTGIDPRLVLLEEHQEGPRFSLVHYIQSETPLCKVFVRATSFPWLRHYRPLIKPNPVAEKEGVAGYEITLDFNGVAIELVPRAASEIKGRGKYVLIAVNEAEEKKNPARKFVTKKSGRWELAPHGINLLDLMTY